jgi:hypothetical protein
MTYFTHINRNVIDANRKHGRVDPPICIRRGKTGKALYASEVELPAGSKIIYGPDGILSCGARLVIASPSAPTIIR